MNTFVYLNHNYSSLLWQFSTQKMFNEGKKKFKKVVTGYY